MNGPGPPSGIALRFKGWPEAVSLPHLGVPTLRLEDDVISHGAEQRAGWWVPRSVLTCGVPLDIAEAEAGRAQPGRRRRALHTEREPCSHLPWSRKSEAPEGEGFRSVWAASPGELL